MGIESTRIGILLFDGVEELDAVGPWEVLSAWAKAFPEDGVGVSTYSPGGSMVTCAKGLRIGSDGAIEDAPQLDVFLHPGGWGTRELLRDANHLALIRALSASSGLMTSVCTGSLVYAAAGLLSGRPATTHWESLGLLRELDPTCTVVEGVRFVDDGNLISAAGVSAGIDMALHLVRRLAGADRARQVRRDIQYDPDPPV